MRHSTTAGRLPLSPTGLLWQSLMASATGLLLVFSFPKFNLSFLAWVAFVPLLYVLGSGIGLRRAFWLGWLSGLIFTFFSQNWIAHSMTKYGGLLTVAAYGIALLFASILAFFPALFAAMMAYLRQSFGWQALALAPLVWAGIEWLRPLLTGITWNAVGISQAKHFPIARIAQYGGVYLVSAEVVAGSTLLILSLKLKLHSVKMAAATILIFGLATLCLPSVPEEGGVPVTVVGVQPNIPLTFPDAPDDPARYFENNLALTRKAASSLPNKTTDLVVWAESPLVLNYDDDAVTRSRLDALAQEIDAHLIINTIAREDEAYFNSAQLISPQVGDSLRRYDKIRLVPFGEYVPWRSVLGRFVPTIVGEFTPGTEALVYPLDRKTPDPAFSRAQGGEAGLGNGESANKVRIGIFICYEAAYPDLVRRFVRNGATLLVNISNDAWFGNTAGAHQHLAHALMRAIENNRDYVRVTNTGVTALITAKGRIIDPLPMFVSGSQAWQAKAQDKQTFYTRCGDWFAIGCVILSGVLLAISILRSTNKLTSPRLI
jgi:apolipoprotein N-acyltransferase